MFGDDEPMNGSESEAQTNLDGISIRRRRNESLEDGECVRFQRTTKVKRGETTIGERLAKGGDLGAREREKEEKRDCGFLLIWDFSNT
jgi:hypothetical protein